MPRPAPSRSDFGPTAASPCRLAPSDFAESGPGPGPPLDSTADSLSRVQGEANPTLTYTISGFVNGDTSGVVSGSASLATTATTASPPGSYPITFTSVALTAANYIFPAADQIPGTLTVTAPVLVSISVSPSNPSSLTGTTLQFTATGIYNNGTQADLTSLVSWASTDPAVATISNAAGSQGLAHAVAPGATRITATLGGVVSAADTYLVGRPSTIFVDAAWAGDAAGSDPDGNGPATDFGVDSFATIQQGLDAVPSGGELVIEAATAGYNYGEADSFGGKAIEIVGEGAPTTDSIELAAGSDRGEVGHHERPAVLSTRQPVGGVGEVADEVARRLVEAHPGPEGGRVGGEVHAVLGQVGAAALEGVGHLGVIRDRGADRLGGRPLAEPVGHVRHVAAGRRAMPLDRLRRQVAGLPAADGGEEGGEVGDLQRLGAVARAEFLDLLSLAIEERPAGGVAREIAALAVDEDALVLAPELPDRGRALGGARRCAPRRSAGPAGSPAA